MKRYVMIVLLVVLGLLVSGCGSAATEAPATSVPETNATSIVSETPTTESTSVPEDPWGYITIPAGQTIKVGLSSALSGGYAVYGTDMLNGVDLAIDKFGGKLHGWTLASEGQDDGCEGAAGVTVAEQFSADPNILGVIGPMCSGSIVPAEDIYATNHVIMITPSGTAVAVTAKGNEDIFRTVPNDDLQAEVTVEYLTKELGLTTLAIIDDQSIYGEGLATAVKEKFTAAGGTVTSFEGINRGESDYSAVVSTSIAGNPQAVYFGGMDAEGMKLVVQLRADNYTGVFFGPDGIKSQPSFADAAGAAAEGSYMTFGAVGGATGYDDFVAAFKAKFSGEPVAYGPGSYDAATILLQAADRVATVDADGNLVIGRKALADSIRATPFDGVTGHLEFNETGDLKVVSITVFQVQQGTITSVKEYQFGQ
jgi:branched-chain amino acid transport system substrate-binding protein